MPARPHDPDQFSMSFGDHLDELRRRLIYSLAGFGVALLVICYYGREITHWLLQPLMHAQQQADLPQQVVGLSVGASFAAYMKVSLIASLIVSIPWLLYQTWRFIAAGLYAHERRVLKLLAPFSAMMVVLGVLFTYHLMLPVCLTFFIGFAKSFPPPDPAKPTFTDSINRLVNWSSGAATTPDAPATPDVVTPESVASQLSIPVIARDPSTLSDGLLWLNSTESALKVAVEGRAHVLAFAQAPLINPMIAINEYLSFVTTIGLGCVVAFQLPVVLMMLGWTGLISPALLASYRRHTVFACFVLAAVLTPADPVSMFVLAIPLLILYELGLLLMRMTYRQRAVV